MATLVCNSTANFTASNVWDVVDTTSFLNSEGGNTAVTTSNLDSATFTPGAITVKGVCLKLYARATSPTGTTTVTLRNSTDSTDVTSVTVNNSDFSGALAGTSVAWHYIKFGSNQLLVAGKAYLIRVTSSVTTQVTLYTNGTANNWSRMLVTSTTATAASADAFHVLGEMTGAGTGNDRTITMNSTSSATSYGNTTNASTIGHRGTLTWASSAATNYILKHAGIIEVGVGGTYNQGTVATPCPRDSTMKMQFASTATNSTAYLSRRGGTVVMQGQSRTSGKVFVQCILTSDLAASGTTLNVDTDTGWLSGDEICITPTARTSLEGEKRTLNANAGASSMVVTAGVTYAHSASRLFSCKVGLLTRNVTIENDNSSYKTGFRSAGSAGSVDCDWVQFKDGDGSATFGSVVAGGVCTQEYDYCSITDAYTYGFIVGTNAGSTVSLRNSVIWNPSTSSTSYTAIFNNSSTSGLTVTVTDNLCVAGTIICGGLTTGTAVVVGAITGNFMAGFSTGVLASGNTALKNTAFSLNNNIAVACTTGFSVAVIHTTPFVITGLKAYHCTGNGVSLNLCRNITLDDMESHGNATGLTLGSGGTGWVQGIRFNDLLTGGTTGFTQGTGVASSANGCRDVVFKDAVFSATAGGKTANTNEVVWTTPNFAQPCEISFINATKQNAAISATPAPATAVCDQTGHISFSRINGTTDGTGDYTVGAYGTLEYDASVYHTAAPSLKMTSLLGTASLKMQSAPPRHRQKVKVASGATSTAAVWVRTSSAYNGNQPRLMVAANASAGIESDTALDTMTVGTATWEELTGTTATVADDCELEFYVDCDGTAGYVNVDDWTIDSKTNDMSIWVDGLPATEVTGAGGGSGSVMFPRCGSVNGI